MKTYKKLFSLGVVALAVLFFVGRAQAAILSQTNVSVAVGQTTSIYATNVSGYLSISSNSNPSIATVSLNGSTVNIYGVTYGSTVITVCDSSSSCNSVYVTVGGSSYSGTLSLSQTSLSMSIGQTSTVTAYNTYNTSSGTLYVSSNSSPYVATASVIGNTLSIYASETGSTTITVCQSYNSSCGTVYVTVNGYEYTGYNGVSNGLNISNITLTTGGSVTLTSSNNNYVNGYYNSGSTGLYVSSNSNPNVASTSTSGVGTTVGCYAGDAYSIVTGQPCYGSTSSYYGSTNNYVIPGCYAGDIYSITTGQSCYGYNNVSGVYNANNNGSLVITAISPGYDTLSVCQSNGGTCSNIYVTVTSGYAYPVSSQTGTTYNSSGIPTVYSTSNAN